jgi:hypothetical protein
MKSYHVAYLASALFLALAIYCSLARARDTETTLWMHECLSEPYKTLERDFPDAHKAIKHSYNYVDLNKELAMRKSERFEKVDISAQIGFGLFLIIGILTHSRNKNEPNQRLL